MNRTNPETGIECKMVRLNSRLCGWVRFIGERRLLRRAARQCWNGRRALNSTQSDLIRLKAIHSNQIKGDEPNESFEPEVGGPSVPWLLRA
jgi:hypothetical protein